jgi:hypothetical protein
VTRFAYGQRDRQQTTYNVRTGSGSRICSNHHPPVKLHRHDGSLGSVKPISLTHSEIDLALFEVIDIDVSWHGVGRVERKDAQVK